MNGISDRDFARLVEFVRTRYGINLEAKRTLVDARLAFYIKQRGYTDFSNYVAKVLTEPNGSEAQQMINRLSTNYTYFFREPDYIEQIKTVVLPTLKKHGSGNLRLWCAACSSGQEAYSVAMVLESLCGFGFGFDYEMLATDINTEMLAAASGGSYPIAELEQIPLKYRQYVNTHRETLEIKPEIKRKISFRCANLLETQSWGAYDIVFCRNVLIYFTPDLRAELTTKLAYAVKPQGYLFTGTTESIDLQREYFNCLAPSFYRRAAAAGKSGGIK